MVMEREVRAVIMNQHASWAGDRILVKLKDDSWDEEDDDRAQELLQRNKKSDHGMTLHVSFKPNQPNRTLTLYLTRTNVGCLSGDGTISTPLVGPT
jgi:hypothetical protein